MFYYGVDLAKVIKGQGPSPALVLSLVRRLPDDSMTRALMLGSEDHFGWGQDRYLLADIFDAINQNTRATGNWAKKAPEISPYPRPKANKKDKQEKKRVTVADLFSRFQKAQGD